MLNEILILNRIREGDIKSFESLFRRYYSPLCWYVTGIIGRTDVAEEIVEELFYILWRDRSKISIFHSVKGYLYRSARNGAMQFHDHQEVRARYNAAQLLGSDKLMNPDPQQLIEYEELRLLIDKALSKLPERRYRIFSLHRIDGKKYAEIAALMSLSIKTVESEMTKALKTLRKEIENYI